MNVRAALHRLYLILKSNNMLSNFTLESEKREYKMSQTGKWGTFWILVIGIAVGVGAVSYTHLPRGARRIGKIDQQFGVADADVISFSLFRLHISLVDVFWTILTKD